MNNPVLLLACNRLPGHKGPLKLKVLNMCRDEHDFQRAADEYQQMRNIRRPVSTDRLLKEAEAEYRRLKSQNIGFLALRDAAYPPMLARIEDPPLVLYIRGEAGFDAKPAAALVGTRRPSPAAERQAFQLGCDFALAGIPVVSGLAFGIDRAAHEGALAGQGATWAVLAGGLDRPGPRSHLPLAHRILENGGALLGEIPPGQYPARYAFPRRNRILSGLCRGCVVVQAPEKSGALITSDFALEQNRDVYIASCGLDRIAGAGTRKLEADGAPVILNAIDVLKDWGRHPGSRSAVSIAPPAGQRDLVRMMKMEIDGRIHRYAGGCFERR